MRIEIKDNQYDLLLAMLEYGLQRVQEEYREEGGELIATLDQQAEEYFSST